MNRTKSFVFSITAVAVCMLTLLLPVSFMSSFAQGVTSNNSQLTTEINKLPKIMWIDHFSFLPGDPTVITSNNAISSGVGGGLTGLVIKSTTLGEVSNGNKVVHRALEIPPGYLIKGIRVCYELSSVKSYISQIRLAQIQNPPSSAAVMLDDPTDLTNKGPICVNSQPTSVDPSKGSILISFRVNFGDVLDKIVIRAVGLLY